MVQKDIELEKKDIEIQSQRKTIDRLLMRVCHLSKKLKTKSNLFSELNYEVASLNQKLKNKSYHISELDNEIVNLNQKLKCAEEKAAQDHIQIDLRQNTNCLNKKFTYVDKINTISEIKDEHECGKNTEETQTKPLIIDSVQKQQSQTVTRTKEEDVQSSETHNIKEGYNISLDDEKTTTDDRAIMKDKKIDCNICSKTFASNRTLRNHVNAVHKKMKPHKCQICAVTFSRISSLKSHVDAIHNNLRPFECKICSKALTTNRSLKQHVEAVHEKMKSHKCQICAKSFSQICHVRSHVNSVHNNLRPLECKICSKKFATNSELKKHDSKVHNKLKL